VSGPTARRFVSLAASLIYWTVPALLSLWLFHRGLWCWFQQDDFSLLLYAQLPDREFWPQLWLPRAQGTFRPLSERLFFYYFYRWFGLDAFPYRLLVFATLVVNLWLLAALTRRLTGRRWAGFAAACLWGLHASLSTSMVWSSAYNQVLCSFFVLISFLLFLLFVSSGNWLYYVAQWVTFLLGFGALETMVVYPGLLLAYVILHERRHWLRVVPMLLASGGLAWFQLQASSLPQEGPYRASYGLELVAGLSTFTRWALAAVAAPWVAVVLAVLLIGFAACRVLHKDYRGLFFLVWFVVALAPYLPLVNHRTIYYLVIPGLGLAMLGGWALVEAWHAGWRYRALMAVSLLLYLPPNIKLARAEVNDNHNRSNAAKQLLSEVSRVRAAHPNKTILLTKLPGRLFTLAVHHEAFRVISVFDVYLTPDPANIEAVAGAERIERFFLPRDQTLRLLRLNRAVVYDAAGPQLQEITREYAASAPSRLVP
jgi:Dolichyl-phosphate-mannose-protein mannosyltransferase